MKKRILFPYPLPNHHFLAFPIHSTISLFTSLNQPVLSRPRRGFDEGALRQGKIEVIRISQHTHKLHDGIISPKSLIASK